MDPAPDPCDRDSGEEGELSDSKVTEKNEEMNYRETVRAVRAFLGWTYIPDFKPAVGDTDNKSDNPWKGKHPRRTGKVSIELPAVDWLCYKMEKLNTRAAEGYPSRSQEAAGLKIDQFIRTPKSQSKWYAQSRLRQEGSERPGKTIFGWSGSEARLNSQFSRIAKVSAYPTSGPASRLVPQEILRHWEKCAREGSLITNHAAGLNRCVSETQEKMNQHISLLNDTIVKGKAPKEVVDAIRDLKDLSAFHSSVSVALGTAFQHLVDSLFVPVVGVVLVPHILLRLPGVQNSINDNQFLKDSPVQLSVSQGDPKQCQSSKTINVQETVNCFVVAPAVSVTGQSQKKDARPFQPNVQIKSVKGVSCVNHCLFAPVVRNALHVVKDPPVGGRLEKFWQVWLSLGSNPRVVSILKEGYSLPFKVRPPPLSRSPVIVSHNADPVKSKNLKDSLQALIQKQAVEKVLVTSSLAFYNQLFLVPKPNNRWRPILDLSQLNLYLASASFKMVTPETIRLSLQQGEWVTSLDFSDAYFHIPINPRSRKFLRFHLNNQSYQFTSLPFGLSTAPLEFTKVVKEVKLMAQARGIRIHQYLDDWLLRAPSQETCLRHTQTLLDLCCNLGWVVNRSKS